VLSVKDKNGYDELLGLCRTGEIVDLVLDDNERKGYVKSGKENLFRMSLCETEDGKSGTQTKLLRLKKNTTEKCLCRMANNDNGFSCKHKWLKISYCGLCSSVVSQTHFFTST